MANDKKTAQTPGADDVSNLGQKLVSINAQYVKDLSFENPKAPGSLVNLNERPRIDVDVNVKVQPFQANMYEVELAISARATIGDSPLFLVSLNYGGLFTLQNITDAEKEMALVVYCPNLLFPYARRIISDTTRDGGFPPLMLDPMDFARLHAMQKQKGAAPKEGAA